jgi:hypothetical protein
MARGASPPKPLGMLPLTRRYPARPVVSTARKRSFRRTLYRGGGTIGLEYRVRLRRAHTPDVVQDRVLHEGAPFVTAAEWAT